MTSNPFTYLEHQGIDHKKLELSEVPKTAEDVERIYGCPIRQVLKTIIFIGSRPVVAVLPGDGQVDEDQLASVVDESSLHIASPEQVEQLTNKSIGHLDPFVRPDNCIAVLDRKVLQLERVNMGGGEPGIGIEMNTDSFIDAWDGNVEDISE